MTAISVKRTFPHNNSSYKEASAAHCPVGFLLVRPLPGGLASTKWDFALAVEDFGGRLKNSRPMIRGCRSYVAILGS